MLTRTFLFDQNMYDGRLFDERFNIRK